MGGAAAAGVKPPGASDGIVNGFLMKIANETNVVIGLLISSQLGAMNAAAPDGTPPRRVNNREHLKNTELPRRAPEGP